MFRTVLAAAVNADWAASSQLWSDYASTSITLTTDMVPLLRATLRLRSSGYSLDRRRSGQGRRNDRGDRLSTVAGASGS